MQLATLRLLASVGTLVFAVGCASSDPIGDPSLEDDNGPQADENAICLLHNCGEDAHCGGCSDGRNTCLVEEARCVACNSDTGTGCPAGEECSSWGNCVPIGLTCETDEHGVPLIGCDANDDCLACDPMHQICDTAQSKCVACTAADTSACQSTDQCVANECSAECPASCTVDNDCASCGGPDAPAHACNAHQCAECSPTFACPAGKTCSDQGVCLDVCGSDGSGACLSDADCSGCGAGNNNCNQPINGGEGTCGIVAGGCSDLGNSGFSLPAPWNQVTNTCSDASDCDGVGITFNVGKLLRDITGIDAIDDANIEYGMNACAAVSIGETSCGVCVPCQVDADCESIAIDGVAEDAFGPLGSLAAALLLDQVFGPNDHEIHMYCNPIAGGYGVCAPCPGIIYECGQSGGGGGGGGTGSCDHDTCTAGSALDPSCSSCAAAVCAADDYCCNNTWDDLCISEVEQFCAAADSCSGGGGGSNPTCHDECVVGDPLDASCNGCVSAICNQDSYCCDTAWDDICINLVDQLCSPPCN